MAPAEEYLHTCRLCFRPIEWSTEHLEYEEVHVYYRCPECRGSFPIRHSDVAAMKAAEDQAKGPAPA